MASFGPPQVAALAILGVLALILGVWFLRWSTAPTWETVSSGLRPAEAADVIDELAQRDAEGRLEQAALHDVAGELDRHRAA